MRRLFIASILLNAALVALAAYGLRQRTLIVPVIPAEIETVEISPASPVANKTSETTVAPASAPGQMNIIRNWHHIESTDYPEYIANLRKIGCPEETIADIITSEVNQLYRTRLAQLPSVPKRDFKFWETSRDLFPRVDPAVEKARREIEQERDELLRTLLGPLYARYKIPGGAAEKWMYDPFFASLSEEKRSRVFDINDRYDAMAQKIRDHRQNYLDEDDRKELRRLRELKVTEMAAVLTPEELQQFQTRFSEEAESVRKNVLSAFDASEQEFSVIVAALKQMQAGSNAVETEKNLKETLGEERYAEYKRSTDWEYRRLVELTKKQNLPKEVALKVYAMKTDAEKAATALRHNTAISSEERAHKFTEIRMQAEQAIAGVLGEQGFKQFQNNAYWLRNLSLLPGLRPAAVIQK